MRNRLFVWVQSGKSGRAIIIAKPTETATTAIITETNEKLTGTFQETEELNEKGRKGERAKKGIERVRRVSQANRTFIETP